jgi:excisionase family DNA binding protein
MQTEAPIAPRLLTVRQVQELLHIDRSTIYRMAADGRLPSIRVGRQLRFPADGINSMVSAADSASDRHAGPIGSGASAPSIDPAAATAAIEVAASMLNVMMVVTDMSGSPVTPIVNPCPGFALATEGDDTLKQCLDEWRELASDTDLAPKFRRGQFDFECARAFVRDGSNLIGMVLVGGIAPADDVAVEGAGLTHLTEAERAQVLDSLPLVARAIAAVRTTEHPSNPPQSAKRPASVGA